MKKIGLVGIGIMSSGMADNYLKNGYEVYVWNRHQEKADRFVKRGAVLCKNPKEVAEKADVIFEITANDESSKSVWTGSDGILAGATKDKYLIASTTISVKWVDELAALCAEKGFTFLDMGLTGSKIGADTGNLMLLVGGEEQKFKELAETLEPITIKNYYFGPAGQGMRYKLILNAIQAIHIMGFGEAMRMAEANGMNLDAVANALVERPGGVVTKIAKGNFHNQPEAATFSQQWLLKDLKYAKDFADSLSTPLLDDVLEAYERAVESGKGDKDWTNINEE